MAQGTNAQNVNINAISRVPFVEKDGILSRSAYYFLLALFAKSGGSNSDVTVPDLQLLEAMDSFTPAGEATLSQQLSALAVSESMGDDSSSALAVIRSNLNSLYSLQALNSDGVSGLAKLSGIVSDLAVLVAMLNDTPSNSSCNEVSSAVGVTSFPATGTYGDLTSINLPVGDWDISLLMNATLNGATATAVKAGISTTSGNSAAGLSVGDNLASQAPPSSANDSSICIPSWRQSVTSPTTYYLKYTAVFSAGTPQASGRISARLACKGI